MHPLDDRLHGLVDVAATDRALVLLPEVLARTAGTAGLVAAGNIHHLHWGIHADGTEGARWPLGVDRLHRRLRLMFGDSGQPGREDRPHIAVVRRLGVQDRLDRPAEDLAAPPVLRRAGHPDAVGHSGQQPPGRPGCGPAAHS